MPYLDQCQYRERDGGYEFTGRCVVTGKPMTVFVKGEELYQWRKGVLIQNALVSNTPDEREFLMSGTSPEGWALLFPPKKEE